MDEKLSFVVAHMRGEWSMAALCEEWGISRKTGYKWVSRYRRDGLAGLAERSRAPRRHGRSMSPAVVDAIVELRRQRPHWGPRKLRAVLMDARPEVVWPAASTMGDLLRSEGLVSARRRRRRVLASSPGQCQIAGRYLPAACCRLKGSSSGVALALSGAVSRHAAGHRSLKADGLVSASQRHRASVPK